MKKLEIQLNQEYRSFQNNFKTILEGDLIILSGVNGSGKTQLFDIIRGFQKESRAAKISRSVQIDGTPITEDQVAHRSIRDYSNVSDLTQGSARIFEDDLNNLWNWYTQFNLNPGANQVGPYLDSCKRARELLIEKIGQDRFNRRDILRDEFNKVFKDFVLYQDDIFTNQIGKIFFRFTTDRDQKKLAAYDNNTRLDESTLPEAPWVKLNNLFDKLKLGYKLRDNFKNEGYGLSEQPVLFALNQDGTLNESERRMLSDLSDGEKAIVSLTFAMLASEDTHPKIIILDEYDAPLNPSLIKAFFTVLKDFFIDNGVQVIIATHSPATLSLAPNYACFYEVFAKNSPIAGRLLPISREAYGELRIANQGFVDRIADLQKIVRNLNEKITSATKPLIITEGGNVEHIKKAIDILDNAINDKIDLLNGVTGITGKDNLKFLFDVMSKRASGQKILFVWDCDAHSQVDPLQENNLTYKFCFAENTANTKSRDKEGKAKGIENLYADRLFIDEVYDTKETKIDYAGQKTEIIFKKEKFLEKIKLQTDPVVFSGFNPLVEKIKSIINPPTISEDTNTASGSETNL